MITIRKSSDRGHFDHGWLNTYHTFSFGGYRDPAHTRFRTLRVINEDFVKPGMGFAPHGHDNMEILTYIVEGELAHKDSTGSAATIRPGDIQRMSAGSGIQHSEFNPSRENPVHLLQIWIFPEKKDVEPGYEEKHFDRDSRRNRFRLVASPEGAEGSVKIGQDARMYAAVLDVGKSVTHAIGPGRGVWLQLIKGEVTVNGQAMKPGDGARIEDEAEVEIVAGGKEAELVAFDLG